MDRKDRLAEWLFVRQGSTACGLWRCVAPYRGSKYFQSARNQRSWIAGTGAFITDREGAEVLSDGGKEQINQVVGSIKDSIAMQPIMVEGYSNDADSARQITLSSQRAILVDHYLVQHFHLHSNEIGVVSLNARPPQLSGKSVWDGVSILIRRHKSSDKDGIATEAETGRICGKDHGLAASRLGHYLFLPTNNDWRR